MSTQISEKTDRLIEVIDDNRAGKLSEGLAVGVTSIERGIYVPGAKGQKPVVYVSDGRTALIRDLAGGLSYDVRLKYKITGVVTAATQALAVEEAELLAANLLMVLLHYSSDAGYWSGAGPGWAYPSDDDSGEDVLEFAVDVGDKISVAHFVLLWSCNCRLSLEEL